MENEGRFMETIKATIVNRDEKHFIQIQDDGNTIQFRSLRMIPMLLRQLLINLLKGLEKVHLRLN